MKIVLLLLIAIFVGCLSEKKMAWDQKLRRKLFFECLDKIPKGPEQTKFNDWDDVVEECGDQAKNLSLRAVHRDSSTSDYVE